ncbi:AAA family ATPase [Alcaligenes faecalis]|uniref:AAA family ATPase n=1 Tax=Alcaligenes ammonioxydans TaxID=2582914 RepID=A0ABX8SY54_9BURK|nr:BTAD domain-containing putative transcriptional regulator [Alcaligenes ammonioxydans]QXX80052.1 AAA family ATPase [Alcaligenes ammonioxydans]
MIVLGLLGPFRFTVDQVDRTASLSYDKVKLLAAVLCLANGKVLHRERLAHMLWPDLARDKALSRLRHALHVLRKALGEQAVCLVAHAEGAMAFKPECVQVDVLEFMQADAAQNACLLQRLSLYGGRFLDAIPSPDAEAFISWRRSWEDRLTLELFSVRARLFEQVLQAHQWDQALALAQDWVLQAPEQEVYHRLLIRALMQRGDRQAALQAYAHCEQALRQYLGVRPDPETRRLAEAQWPVAASHAPPTSTQSHRTVATLALALSWLPADDSEVHLDGELMSDQAVSYLESWHEQLLDILRAHGAWISQSSGSTLLAHFAWPHAQSEPVNRAVELACVIRALRTPPGICIGQVVHVSLALVDEQQVNTHSLFGQLVMPLVWKARHGEILLSAQAVARMADWQIKQHRGPEGVCFSLGEGKWMNDPLYGCQPEFEQLVAQWQQCSRLSRKAAYRIHGDLGSGKSRLAQALHSYIVRDGGQPLLIDFSRQDVLQGVREMMQARLDDGIGTQDLPLALSQCLRDWFGLSDPHWDQVLQEAHRQKTEGFPGVPDPCHLLLAAVQAFTSQSRPVLVILDHVDALDTGCQNSLAAIWSAVQKQPAGVLLVILSRQSLLALDFAQSMTLRRLTGSEVGKAIGFYARGKRLSSEANAQIRAQCLSNPMLIKDMLHLQRFGMPFNYVPRLADRLLLDLEQLDADRRCVLLMMVLWERATPTGLAQACNLPLSVVEQSRISLLDKGLLQQDSEGRIVCAPLMRSALRRLIAKEESKVLYGKLAHSLIQMQQAEEEIAACLVQAQSAQAAIWWRKAIDTSLRSGDSLQAAQQLSQVLSSLQYMSDVQLRRQYERDSYVTLGALEISRGGPAAIPVSRAYAQAAGRSEGGEEDLPVLWGQWVMLHGAGRLPESLAHAKQLQEHSRRQGHSAWYGWGLYAEAQYLFWKGRVQPAELALDEALRALAYEQPVPAMDTALGHHCPALVHSLLGLTQVLQGRFEQGVASARHAQFLASQSQSRISAVIAEIQMLRILYLQGDLEVLTERSQALLSTLQPVLPDSVWCAVAETYVLYCRLVKGEETRSELARLLGLLPEFARSMPLATDAFLCILARCHLAQGEIERASQALDQVCQIGQERASTLYLPELDCLRGDLAWVSADRDQAQVCWAQAQQEVLRSGLYAYEGWLKQRCEHLPDLAERRVWVQRHPG